MQRIYVEVRGNKLNTRCRDSRYAGYSPMIPRIGADEAWKAQVARDVNSFVESQKLSPLPVVFLEVIPGGLA